MSTAPVPRRFRDVLTAILCRIPVDRHTEQWVDALRDLDTEYARNSVYWPPEIAKYKTHMYWGKLQQLINEYLKSQELHAKTSWQHRVGSVFMNQPYLPDGITVQFRENPLSTDLYAELVKQALKKDVDVHVIDACVQQAGVDKARVEADNLDKISARPIVYLGYNNGCMVEVRSQQSGDIVEAVRLEPRDMVVLHFPESAYQVSIAPLTADSDASCLRFQCSVEAPDSYTIDVHIHVAK